MIRRHLSLLLAAASLAVATPAQGLDGYDPGRSCRSYVVQRLPVPVRCMAELLGNWSPKPYIDGAFMFRNREEWLLWRDRDDYRRWKARQYGTKSAEEPTRSPLPQPVTGQPAAALLCPASLKVEVPAGWSGSVASLPLQSPPQIENGVLSCRYGRDTVVLTRPAWGHCSVRTDGTGFDCTP